MCTRESSKHLCTFFWCRSEMFEQFPTRAPYQTTNTTLLLLKSIFLIKISDMSLRLRALRHIHHKPKLLKHNFRHAFAPFSLLFSTQFPFANSGSFPFPLLRISWAPLRCLKTRCSRSCKPAPSQKPSILLQPWWLLSFWAYTNTFVPLCWIHSISFINVLILLLEVVMIVLEVMVLATSLTPAAYFLSWQRCTSTPAKCVHRLAHHALHTLLTSSFALSVCDIVPLSTMNPRDLPYLTTSLFAWSYCEQIRDRRKRWTLGWRWKCRLGLESSPALCHEGRCALSAPRSLARAWKPQLDWCP